MSGKNYDWMVEPTTASAWAQGGGLMVWLSVAFAFFLKSLFIFILFVFNYLFPSLGRGWGALSPLSQLFDD